ncbi:MAG TPA: hypothetical protein PKU94_02175 [Candidatus Hydrothermia bacterium]|nr:hypothetical protein [Candidatus Hydrothermia bacterium]HOP32171.1 hypothetical protein [Candidatus Hydrothermia bacterium]
MIGIELDFEKCRLVRRERARILEFDEGSPSSINRFKGEDIYICFSAPAVVGKLYSGGVSKKIFEEEFGTAFEFRKAGFTKDKSKYTFAGGVEKKVYHSVIDFLKSLKISRIKRLDFSPFVFHDLIYTFNFAAKYKDFLALSFNNKYVYYMVCKGGLVWLTSSMESEDAMEAVPELVKTFFEEGINTFLITGDYSKDLPNELRQLGDDAEIEILNPFSEFTIITPKEVRQATFSLALGVTL